MPHAVNVAFSGKQVSEIWTKALAFRASGLPAPSQPRLPAGSNRPHEDFVVPFQAFANSLKGTPDEVWTKYLRSTHGMQKMTFSQWRATLDAVQAK